jgi:hypothetical protein
MVHFALVVPSRPDLGRAAAVGNHALPIEWLCRPFGQ